MPSSSRMMAISVVMAIRYPWLGQINTLNYRLKMPFEETFRGQETGKFRRRRGAHRRAGQRHFADRADGECVRIRRLAFRVGVRAVAARLPDCDAGQFARRHRGLDPARVASERHAEGAERRGAPDASRRSRQFAIWPEEAAFAGFYRQSEQWRLAPQHHLS